MSPQESHHLPVMMTSRTKRWCTEFDTEVARKRRTCMSADVDVDLGCDAASTDYTLVYKFIMSIRRRSVPPRRVIRGWEMDRLLAVGREQDFATGLRRTEMS